MTYLDEFFARDSVCKRASKCFMSAIGAEVNSEEHSASRNRELALVKHQIRVLEFAVRAVADYASEQKMPESLETLLQLDQLLQRSREYRWSLEQAATQRAAASAVRRSG